MGGKSESVNSVKSSQSTDAALNASMKPKLFDLSLRSLKLTTKQEELLTRVSVLCLVYVLAFIIRLFSVLRYESMIHEFDPYFNYRTTLYLTEKGFYEFWNWFDFESWYPLGRIIGGTLYPGLMVTAAAIYWVLRFLRFFVHIREVCVLTAPFFASNTTLVAYFFGKELWDSGAGLVAAALIAICPGYISRSVAGSYDNEGVAIFALLLTFYLFVKAVNTGSLAWGLASAFGYFYMVSAWGGYVFIINLIPLYVLVLLITGRYSMRLYVAYNCMYILGMLLAMQIRFVGFQHVQSGEHMAAMGVFFLLQVFYFLDWVKHLLSDTKLFEAFLRITVTSAVSVGVLALGVGTASGYISPWTGRFYSLLDPTYAKDHIPIIASVSEHQPTAWSSFMFDFHILLILFPAGLYFCFKRLSDATIFIVMYGLTSMYFAGVMVRLILVATPAVCLISAIAVSATIKNLTSLVRTKKKSLHTSTGKSSSSKASLKGMQDQSLPFQRNGAIALLIGAFYLLSRYAIHCTWVTSEAYSSPSIVLAARGPYGGRVIFDDYREAYFWLRQNTPRDAKIMSWWDYGYQITAMGNRTVIVDNNTWNNTHIATVGRAMSSYEDEAYEIMQSLDVDYVLVVFGGVTGYSSDDINKFLWMVRIGGGVFPVIKEPDYLVNGEYRVDKGAAPKMLNCLMYKLSYYRFGELTTEYGQPPGYDRARGVEIGNKDIKLEHLEEAFTTSNWIVRIYKVKPPRESTITVSRSRAVKPIVNGRDVIAQAQSGTGKTSMIAITVCNMINTSIREVQALVLSPTRELASQTEKMILAIGSYISVQAHSCIGGKRIGEDVKKLENGVHVVSGTPGRVHDMIKRRTLRTKAIKLLVLDESDEMLSRGFKEQIYDVYRYLPPEIQGIKQFYVDVEKEEWKFDALCDLYQSLTIAQAVIFCNTKRKVDWLTKKMCSHGFPVSSMHGDMPQKERDAIMAEFRSVATRVLITTDIWARGLDVQQVSLVINYDLPSNRELYIHRIGRSGRFGCKGMAINFVRSEDKRTLKEIAQYYGTQIDEYANECC
ncbi:hypothetical protein H6P81_017787 [Aristolochia fimbriata]|uniref:Dolichyl-diphosphooligosaccharide--protein glycotransferase n=1 Tax=Aristolochia fimbriata TaxID=158543 RepID=A0AAV7E3G0_ARIFI|nr:hypothetical protein H6P81_017787 [Aristolochia fimbriata]